MIYIAQRNALRCRVLGRGVEGSLGNTADIWGKFRITSVKIVWLRNTTILCLKRSFCTGMEEGLI